MKFITYQDMDTLLDQNRQLIETKLYLNDGQYELKLAATEREKNAAYRLRYNVFNKELNEGLPGPFWNRMDKDEFDPYCDHLIIKRLGNKKVVGTYRMQNYEMAQKGLGFYSAREFDLSNLNENNLSKSLELGRACVEPQYRNTRVLALLWRGIAAYLSKTNSKFVFGCCSLSSTNLDEGYSLYYHLLNRGYVDIAKPVLPTPDYYFPDPGNTPDDRPNIPILMKMYLRYGARVLSLPAIDREFNTIDYFMMIDVEDNPNLLLQEIMLGSQTIVSQ